MHADKEALFGKQKSDMVKALDEYEYNISRLRRLIRQIANFIADGNILTTESLLKAENRSSDHTYEGLLFDPPNPIPANKKERKTRGVKLAKKPAAKKFAPKKSGKGRKKEKVS